jgi:replicative DNA helicase
VSRYQGEVSGVPSGFEHLDRLTAGFQRGEFIVVAGRPGMGKTALVLNVALRAAVGHRQPVGIFSLEMSGELVAQRLLCTEAHVDGQLVRTGRLNEMMWNRLSKAVGTLTDAPIYIDDSPNLSPLEVRAKGRRLVHEHSAQLLIVDYLQLMRLPFRVENRAQEVGEISQSLKALAKDLDIPIIACSQVTREVEKRGDTRPKLSDLRESGSIEQDADVVMFVHRPEYYHILQDEQGRSLEGVAEILVEKQRNGPTGKVLLRWFDQYGLFEPLAPEEMEPAPEGAKVLSEEIPPDDESPF